MGSRGRREVAGRRHRGPQGPLRLHGGSRLIAVDTNVLVYAHRRSFPQHDAALRALRRLAGGDETWGLPVFVLSEFVRVVTHPSILRPPSTVELAIASLDALLGRANVVLLNPGERFWELLRSTLIYGRASGNLALDAQIVAVCRENGVDEILTEDRDFARFGIAVRSLNQIA